MTVSQDAHAEEKKGRLLIGGLAILTGVSLIGLSFWGGPILSQGENTDIRRPDIVWLLHFWCGAAALVGIGFAQAPRSQLGGKLLLGAAGVALLGGLTVFTAITERALLTVALPAVILLVSAVFVGPLAPADRTVS